MITSHQVTSAESVGWHQKFAGTPHVASLLFPTLYIDWHMVMPRSQWLCEAKDINSSIG